MEWSQLGLGVGIDHRVWPKEAFCGYGSVPELDCKDGCTTLQVYIKLYTHNWQILLMEVIPHKAVFKKAIIKY